jgi:hypothetical protein
LSTEYFGQALPRITLYYHTTASGGGISGKSNEEFRLSHGKERRSDHVWYNCMIGGFLRLTLQGWKLWYFAKMQLISAHLHPVNLETTTPHHFLH